MDLPKPAGARAPEALRVGEEVLDVVVDHMMFRRVRDACLDLVHNMRSLKMPSGILIQAEPGMGKTLLLDLIQREVVSRAPPATERLCPLLALDNAVDSSGIAGAMLIGLGYVTMPSRHTLATLNNMVNAALERYKPWGMLIDEMQHVCEGNKDITARSVTDWIKVRMDAHNFPVICAGTRALERLTVINPQFTSRASANFVLLPLQFDDTWRQILAGFAAAVKGVDLRIVNGPACRPLHQASGGNMRSLKRILAYACMHAAIQPQRVVSLLSLAVGFDEWKGQVAEQLNPFRVALKDAR